MTDNLMKTIRKIVEIAKFDPMSEVETNAPSIYDGLLAHYESVIERSNEILDRKKTDVFSEVLDLTTRGDAERAVRSYDHHYLLSLNLSLEATSELAYELIEVAKRFRVTVPQAWLDIAHFQDSFVAYKKREESVRKVVTA